MTTLCPFSPGSSWAWRVEAQIGAVHAGQWLGPTIHAGVGIDFEALVH